jgi:FdhD protein
MIVPRRRTSRVRVTRFRDGKRTVRDDLVTIEEPLEIRVVHSRAGRLQERSISVTMRTPGDDFELAAGFLFTEGLLTEPGEIRDIRYCTGEEEQEYNLLQVRLTHGSPFDPDLLERNFYMTSSCGVCGKASLDAVEVRGCSGIPDGTLEVSGSVLTALPDALRASQPVFDKTGGIHAAALFDAHGTLDLLREDVGRHNAVDKVIGNRFLEGRIPLSDRLLTVSGRTSFEIMQKAVMAGIPMVVAVGAPSTLAIELALRFNMTLMGFTRAGGFNVYAGPQRVLDE